MPGQGRPELSVTGLIAGAAATITATVASSYFGVGGTLVGAGVVSVLSTAGATVYQHFLDRGKARLAAKMPVRVPAGGGEDRRSGEDDGQTCGVDGWSGGADRRPGAVDRWLGGADGPPDGVGRQPGAVGRRSGAVGRWLDRVDERSGGEPATARADRWPWPRWYVLCGAAVGIFVAVMGLVTVFELATGRPLSDTVQGRAGRGTSVHPVRVTARPTPRPELSRPVLTATATPSSGPAAGPVPLATPTPSVSATPTPVPRSTPTAATAGPAATRSSAPDQEQAPTADEDLPQ